MRLKILPPFTSKIQTREKLPPGRKFERREGVGQYCAALLKWVLWMSPGLPVVSATTFPSFLTPILRQAMRNAGHEHVGFGLTQERHQPSLDGCQAGPAQVLGTKGIPIISPSPVCIVYSCKLLLLGLPWEQLWVPSGCTELNFSWGSSFHLHGQPSAHPTKSGSMSGERLLVHCVRGWCTASPKQRLINECLHSTSKVWRAI